MMQQIMTDHGAAAGEVTACVNGTGIEADGRDVVKIIQFEDMVVAREKKSDVVTRSKFILSDDNPHTTCRHPGLVRVD